MNLLSALLPVLVAILMLFLLSLPVTGLQALWGTNSAAVLLTVLVAIQVIVTTATYQDGTATPTINPWLRSAGTLAALVIAPLTALAFVALWLRVRQHGFTEDRILAGACLLTVGWHAAGYAIATFRRGPWLVGIERTNIIGAFITIGLFVALYSPLANPRALSADSQARRLESGIVSPEEFDFAYLKFETGRFGPAHIKRWTANPPAPLQSEAGSAFLRRTVDARTAWSLRDSNNALSKEALERITTAIKVYPQDQLLPSSLLEYVATTGARQVRDCGVVTDMTCEAFLIDFSGDEVDEVVFAQASPGTWNYTVYWQDEKTAWHDAPELIGSRFCRSDLEALRSGAYRLEAPSWKLMRVGDRLVGWQPTDGSAFQASGPDCN